MANHKRRRPKQRRAGCLLCKPQKLHALRFDAEQNLVGVTILGAKRLVERGGNVTCPGGAIPSEKQMSMIRTQETTYRARLGFEVAIDVHFLRRRREVIDYTVVLLARERGELQAVRVYDNTHGDHDMHRYNREGVKQPAEIFHRGSASEALQSAIEAVRSGYREMIESWRR